MVQSYKLELLLLFLLASCTSYIWPPVAISKHKEVLDSFVGQDFSNYPGPKSPEHLINETTNFKEFEYSVFRNNKTTKCSWALKVNKKTNIIESWRYTTPYCE